MEEDIVTGEIGITEHGSDSENNPNQSEVGIVQESERDSSGKVSQHQFQDNHNNEIQETCEVEEVLVSTDGLISEEQLRERFPATHIVIQDVNTAEFDALKGGVKSPLTPFSPYCHTDKFRWLETSHNDQILPIRCKTTNGELHKSKFGSGGKGKCIYSKDAGEWFTPSEFESFAGRANSKDWKRSIRYGGRTINYLIRESVLQPHATTCTCASCCDDDDAVGPVRLFTPYKRRKKDNSAPAKRTNRENSTSSLNSKDEDSSESNLTKQLLANSDEASINTTSCEETVQVMMADSVVPARAIVLDAQRITSSKIPSPIVTAKSFQSTVFTSPDNDEHKLWWQLEEKVKSLINYGLELKQLVEQVKNKAESEKLAAVQAIKLAMEEDKKQALNAARVEAELSLSRALIEVRSEKEIAIQEALNQARAEMNEKLGLTSCRNSQKCVNCNREAISKFSGYQNQPYCSIFCQKKDSLTNKTENNRIFTASTTLDESYSAEEVLEKD